MPGSDGDNTTKTRLIPASLTAAVIVLLFTAWGCWTQLGYHEQAANQSAQYERWAKNEIRGGCPSFAGLNKTQCAYQAKQAAQENKRNEYDLYAQRTSALWAGIMAVAALVGIGLSGVGVYLVFTTFKATRDSADLARDNLKAFHQSERAILHAIGGDIGYHSKTKERTWFIEVFNRGRSFGRVINLGNISGDGPQQIGAPRWTVIGPGEKASILAGVAPDKDGDAGIEGDYVLTYSSVGGKIYHSHFKAYVEWNSDDGYQDGEWVVSVTNGRGHPDDT